MEHMIANNFQTRFCVSVFNKQKQPLIIASFAKPRDRPCYSTKEIINFFIRCDHKGYSAAQLENITKTLTQMLEGYDIRLRPNFGGKSHPFVKKPIINFVLNIVFIVFQICL